MESPEMVEDLVKENEDDAKLILLVLDGVGDIRHPDFGDVTPLEAATTPNLDGLAARSALGRTIPVDYGVTPGSGPAHLGLFGYDPRQVEIGRGVLEALGLDMDLQPGDIAARANVCTIRDGLVVDRRAGRPPTAETARICERLQKELARIDDVEVTIQTGKGHRFALIFRGEGLVGGLNDTDPHLDGRPVHKVVVSAPGQQKTVRIINEFQTRANELLAGNEPANGILMRGFAARPDIRGMDERYGLRPAAVATYPMYRGLAKLAGMELLQTGLSTEEEFQTVADNLPGHDYFFIHVKGTDEAGEDGDFDRKVSVIEEVDDLLPMLLGLEPTALVVTGDHSTPCPMRLHSWHPVPLLLHSQLCGSDGMPRFTEHYCNTGSLGVFRAMHIMPLMLANAGLLDKFGA